MCPPGANAPGGFMSKGGIVMEYSFMLIMESKWMSMLEFQNKSLQDTPNNIFVDKKHQ